LLFSSLSINTAETKKFLWCLNDAIGGTVMKNKFVPTVVILAALWCSCSLSPVQAQQKPAEPKLGGAQVTVPWEDFRELMGRAKEEAEPPKPPVDFAISRAVYVGSVEGETARFDVTMQLTVLQSKDWTVVPIASSALGVDQMLVDGKPATLVTRDNWHALLFEKAGTHEIKFQLTARVAKGEPSESLVFALPSATQVSLDLNLPRTELTVSVANALDFAQQVVADKGTRVTAKLPAAAQLAVRWEKAFPAPEQREPRLTAKVYNLVSIESESLNVEAYVSYDLLNVASDKFVLLVPLDVSVKNVSGELVHSWQAKKDGQSLRVTVQLKSAARHNCLIQLSLERALAADKLVSIPIIEPQGLNATAHGEIAVTAAKNAELTADDAKNASKIDTREISSWLAEKTGRPLALAYSYTRPPQIQLSVTRHRLVAVLTAAIDLAVYSSTFTLDGQQVTKAQFFIRNNESQYLRVKLPEGARVWSAIVNGQGVKPVTDAEGLLLVPIVKSRYLTEDEIEERKEKKREDLRGLRQQRERTMRERSYPQLQDELEQRELKAYPVEVVYAETLKQPFRSGGWKVVAARLPQVQQIPIAHLAWALYLPQELRLDETRGTVPAVSVFSEYGQDEELLEALMEHRGVVRQQLAAAQAAQQRWQEALQQAKQAKDAQNNMEARERGLLPVKVEVPRVGQLRRFEKLLVSPTDELKIEFDYKLPSEAAKQ
jgi:hypothetical protein